MIEEKSSQQLQDELRQTRIWLQEILCVMLNSITFEGFLRYCDAYSLDAEELLRREADYCGANPIEVDWGVAMARDIWERAGFQREQEIEIHRSIENVNQTLNFRSTGSRI